MRIRPALRSLAIRVPAVDRVIRGVRDRHAMKQLKCTASSYGFTLLGGNYLIAGLHEPLEMALVSRALSSADVLIDCGANGGLFTCLAAARGVPAIAIEPSVANLAVLYRNLRANCFAVPVEVFPVALGDSVHLGELYGRGQGASLVRGWGGQPEYDFTTVPVLPLDTLLGHRFDDQRVVLKIDVEGAEWSVLQGAGHLLAQRPFVLIELSLDRNQPNSLNPHFRAIFELFWGLGYTAHAIDSAGTLITPADVTKWLAARMTTMQSENVWFTPPALHD
jgi:FkbM family methyltransferase